MPKKFPLRHLPICVLLIVVFLTLSSQAKADGQVGDPAADFNLEDTWGQWHMLQDLRQNKVVLLNVMGFG